MNRSTLLASALTLTPALAGLTGCSAFGANSDGLKQVDDLLVRIERVHVEAVISKDRVKNGMQSLIMLVNPDEGGPEQAFISFVNSIDAAEAQAEELGDNVVRMKRAADTFFSKWEGDLEEFTSERMRERSSRRMAETRDRYDAILRAVEPALTSFDAFNANLRDLSLFVEYDFNAAAVAEIQGDVQTLTQEATQLALLLDACRQASQKYVEQAALVGQVAEAPAPAPAAAESDPDDGK